MARLGDVCEKKIDTLKSTYKGTIDYIDISSVDNQRKEITQIQRLAFEDAPSRAKQIVYSGDILVSTVRPNLNAVALINQSSDTTLVASTGYCVLRCLPKVEKKYIFHFCQSPTFIEKLVVQATGASYPAVTSTIVKECLIPLPPLDEQRRIAATLDKVTDLIAKRRQQLDKLDELVKARFMEMFDKQYPENTLSKLCNIIDYRGKTPEKADNGFPFITAKNVKMHCMILEPAEYISEETYNKVMVRGFPKEGDVVFTTEAPLGNVCRIPHFDTPFYIGQRIVTLQTTALNPIYLEFALDTETFKNKIFQNSSGSTVTGIRVKLFEQLTIPVPPPELQNQFADFVEQTQNVKNTISRSLEQLETLKKALVQEYFG